MLFIRNLTAFSFITVKHSVLRLHASCSDTVRYISSDDTVPGRIQDHVCDGGQRQQTAGRDHRVSDGSVCIKRDVNIVTVILLFFLIDVFLQEIKHVHQLGENVRL